MKAKCNGHLTFKPEIDNWGVRIVRIFHGDWMIAEALLLLFFVRTAV